MQPRAAACGDAHCASQVMGVLRILGSASTFFQIQGLSGISESSMRQFFHSFCEHFATDCFSEFVYPPDAEQVVASNIVISWRDGPFLPRCLQAVCPSLHR
jgi:hypothetical protein